ncbi:MAG: hypothetical protein KC708_02395 [Anaerolineae bacterium]|nr:hypothetical protein [Anaerolineae bacterium]
MHLESTRRLMARLPRSRVVCRFFLLTLLLIMLAVLPAVAQAQVDDIITMQVDAGFGGYFRENDWLPLRVSVQNGGPDLTGKLIVRPETSGTVVSNAYSTPINLPNGASQSVFLYIQARAFPPEVTVELLDEAGSRAARIVSSIRVLEPEQSLHVIVAGPNTETVVLGAVNAGGFTNQQVRWDISNIPDNALALEAVDTMILMNIDSESLSTAQRDALTNWVAGSGHLIVTGGPQALPTAAAISSLLPLVPDTTVTVDDLSGLSELVISDDPLEGPVVIASGEVRDDAYVLAANADGMPLVARWQYGGGTVDYIAADPTLVPMRNWDASLQMWFNLVASANSYPAWTNGILNYDEAAVSIAIMPGIELLPPVTSMLLYLVLYILLIGPVNYFLLSRINRRGLAWITIPLLIAVFAGLSWTVGFNLRGNDVIVSRLHIIESWPNADEARIRELIGVLSPRRQSYDMSLTNERFLRVMSTNRENLLSQNLTQSTAEIVQDPNFGAQDFSVDGGIFANFIAEGMIERPAISGSLTLTFNPDNTQTLQGAIRNDSDITLTDAVLLTRSLAYHLGEPFMPGDVQTISPGLITLAAAGENPLPSPLEYTSEDLVAGTSIARLRTISRANNASTNDVLGLSGLTGREINQVMSELGPGEVEVFNRRAALLNSFMIDQFGSTGRGHNVYLVGWSNEWPRDLELGAPWSTVDTTLYIVELDLTIEQPPSSQRVQLTPDEFTWVGLDRNGVDATSGPNDLLLVPNSDMTLRFMPIDSAMLSEVDEIGLYMDRGASRGIRVALEIWNWQTETWDLMEDIRTENYVISNPEPYLGPRNMVDIRVSLGDELGSARMQGLWVTQAGNF